MEQVKKDAVDRANEMFTKTKGTDIPALAWAYAQALGRRYGCCCEVVITAYAHYAQIEEGLPCSDELYRVSADDRALFEEVRASMS